MPKSDIRVKSYDHFNFTRASVVQFRGSRYVMPLNRKSDIKVMTIWISRELSLFNFKRLDILCAWIWCPSEKLWPFECLKSFRCSILSVSIYYKPESEMREKSYDHLNFSRAFTVHFWVSRSIMDLTFIAKSKVMAVWIFWELPCTISRVSIYCEPELDILVKSYDHLYFSRASIVHLRASRYIMGLTHTPESKVMAVWIAQELS